MMDARSLSSNRNGETEALMMTFQKNGLEEDPSESQEILVHLKGMKEEFTIGSPF